MIDKKGHACEIIQV